MLEPDFREPLDFDIERWAHVGYALVSELMCFTIESLHPEVLAKGAPE
jgi:hypothetical protein